MNMGSYEYRNKLEKYTKEIIKDLEEVKSIDDVEKQCSKVSFDVTKHKRNFEELKQGRPEDIHYSDSYWPFNLEKYEKKVKELDDYWGKMAGESNKIREQKKKEQRDKEHELRTVSCAYCKNKPQTDHYIYSEKNKILKSRKRNAYAYKKEWLFCSNEHFEKWHKKNYFCCAECLEENYTGKYKYNKSKKDGQKFCSDNCYYKHYAEKCDNCYEKCISSYQSKATGFARTYYSDMENKTGTLCSKCHQEQLKELSEEERKDEEWEERSKRMDENLKDLVDGMVDVVANGKDKDNSGENDNHEDDSQSINQSINQIQYFDSNSISSVELTSEGDLVIKKDNQNAETIKNENLSSELRKLKTQMEKKGTKKLSKADLERELARLEVEKRKLEKKNQEQNPEKSSLGIKIGIGALVVVGLVILVVVIVGRKRKRKY